MRAFLGHFDLDIDFWPHFSVYCVWSISPRLQLTFLKSVLCLTNSFGGIRHVTVTFLVYSYIPLNFITEERRREQNRRDEEVCTATVMSAKSDSDIMFCLHSYQGLGIDRSLVY